ncbi:MAG TPA: Ig-like domain-containing protein, partial [Candidatus Acidoferrum sp.]|nr:Ig-like domain-containing protein [Candidatus Acidoferrum sp.]
ACTPTAATSAASAFCTATLTTTLSTFYPPIGAPRMPNIPRIPAILALLSLLLFVFGLRRVPEARRRAYTYAGLLVIALLVGVVAGCGGGGGGGGSTRNITASYPGDANYKASTAPGLPILIQ